MLDNFMGLIPMLMSKSSDGGDDDDDKSSGFSTTLPARNLTMPSESYRPGIDPQHNYFPTSSSPSGAFGTSGSSSILQNLISAAGPAERNVNNPLPVQQSPDRLEDIKFGGTRYAEGGMINTPFDITLGESTMAPPETMGGGLSDIAGVGASNGLMGAPVTPQPEMPMFQEGGAVIGQQDPRVMLIDAAEAALMGQHPNPEQAIQEFIAAFGEAAFERLQQAIMAKISGEEPRMVQGPGGPKGDKIPARIDGVEEARLSDSEVVIPADAVAGAGAGDTDLGASRLMQLSQQLSGKPPMQEMPVQKVPG